MIIDEFKQYCRDKGKYNITNLPEILKIFNEFEKKKNNTSIPDEPAEASEIDFSGLLTLENENK